MISDSVLREVIGTDFLRPISSSNLAFSDSSMLFCLFFIMKRFKLSHKERHGLFAVFELGALGLAPNIDTGWFVYEADGTFYLVDVLTARAGGGDEAFAYQRQRALDTGHLAPTMAELLAELKACDFTRQPP